VILSWAESSFSGSRIGPVDKDSGTWSSVSTSVSRLSANETLPSPVSVSIRRCIVGRRPGTKKLNILQQIISSRNSGKNCIPDPSNRSSRVQFHDPRLSFVGPHVPIYPRTSGGKRKLSPFDCKSRESGVEIELTLDVLQLDGLGKILPMRHRWINDQRPKRFYRHLPSRISPHLYSSVKFQPGTLPSGRTCDLSNPGDRAVPVCSTCGHSGAPI